MKKNLVLVLSVIIVSMFCASLWGTLLIDPNGDGGFENGATFAENGWTMVNGTQTNKWEMGTAATGYSGNRAAYASNNGGTGWTYSLTTTSVVYFYRDIAFPAGEGDIQLSFDFRGTGESIFDYLRVFLVPTSTTPAAGTLLSTGQIGNTYYNFANEWIRAGISIPAVNAGTTQRLVFCWRNDGSGGFDPPVAIDNIQLTSNVPSGLNGIYYVNNTVATGGIYFNNLVDAVLALNNNGVSGLTTFRISAGQTFTNMLPHITATGTETNRIEFVNYGAGNNPKLRSSGTGNTSTAPFDAGVAIAGGDWIIFNGLDIELTGPVQTGASAFVYPLEYGYYIYNVSGSNGAQNNSIINCKITLNRLNTSTIGIYQNIPNTPTSSTGANSNNLYRSNTIENVYNGIYLKGLAAYPDNSCQVNINIIGAATANDIGNGSSATYGIRVDSGSNTIISGNTVRNITGTSSSAVDGIYVYNLGSGTVNVGTLRIDGNAIFNISSTSTSAGRVCGMRVNITGATGSLSQICNNMVWGLNSASTSTTSRRIIGIFVQDAGGGTTNAVHHVDFNSVLIDHINLATVSSAYEIGTTSGPVINTRSNIFANFTGNQTGSAYHTAWASTSATLVGNTGSVSDNNILYIHNGGNGNVGRGSSTNYPLLIDWQSAMGQDGNSRASNPQFAGSNSLHVSTTVPTPVESNGIFQSWVVYDHDGQERSMSTPDIGADEGDFLAEIECVPPDAQPLDLVLIPAITSIAGSFTASDAEAYLTVRHTDPDHDSPPSDTAVYSVGNVLGNATVIGTGSSTSFNTTGLTADTFYYFTVYAYNASGLNGPRYLVDGPLTGSMQTLPAAPAAPAAFTATAFDYQQINLAVTSNGNDDNIMIAWNPTSSFGTPLATGYSVGDPIIGGGTVLYMGPASGLTSHSGLNQGAIYYYRAWSYLAVDRETYYVYSTALSANATTPVVPQSVPVTEDFESITAAGTFPLGWTRAGTRWTSQIAPQTYNRAAYSGTDYLTCQWSATTTDWMFSRGINLDASIFYDFSIMYNTDGLAGWTSFKMYIGSSASGAAMTTELASVSNPNNMTYAQLARGAWQPPSSGVYYIGLQVIATSSPWYMSFDDFTVSETPAIPVFSINPGSKAFGNQQINMPSASQVFTISNVGGGTLTIDPAISIGGTDADQFVLTDINSYPVMLGTGQTISVSVTFLPTSTGAKTAYLEVNDNLSKTVHQVPLSGTGQDYTIYTASLPYTQNFDSVTAPTLPFGWTKVVSSISSFAYVQTYTSSTPLTTPNHLYLTNSSDATAELVAITPPLEAPLNTLRIKFWAKAGSSGYPLQIGTMDAMGSKAAFTLHQTINLTSTYTQYEVSLGSYAGSDNNIAFRHGLGGTYRSLYIDDIMIEEIPTIPAFLVTPASKNFGDVQIQTSSYPQIFTVKNNGGGTMTVSSVSLTGDDMAHYILDDLNTYPVYLGADQSMTVTVTFHPGTIGTKNASLKIVDNLSKNDNYVALTGVGVDMTIRDLPHIQTLVGGQALYWQQFAIGTGVTNRWTINNSSNAGGVAPEWQCAFQNINPGITRLVSPPVSVTGLSQLVVKYRQLINDYGVGCRFKFGYGYTIDSFFDVWYFDSASNTTYPSEEKTFTFTSELDGHDVIYFRWEIEGNLFQFDYWYLDNIKFLLENTEINQVSATGPTATVVVPTIIVDGSPVSPEVSFEGLSGNPIITVSAAYDPTALPNAGLALTIDGGNLDGVTMTFTHGLGFTPLQIAYRIGTGEYVIVSNPGTWDDFTASIVITGGKGPLTVSVVFPKDATSTLPVELSTFAATLTAEMFVNVAWVAASETNHLGYNVLRGETDMLGNAIQINQNVITEGTAVGTQVSYSYLDTEVEANGTYYYWLESLDLDGTSVMHGPVSILVTGEPGDPGTPPLPPTVTKLLSAYPNPFNPSTNIRYSLKEAGKVRIEIYNVKGQMIRTYENNHSQPGYYQIMWDGRDASGRAVSSGLYLYRMTSGHYRESRKMVLAK